jgi:RES domain-containing protein
MVEFVSDTDYYSFAHHVRKTSRFVVGERQRLFLEAVLESSVKRRATLSAGTHLFRAQVAHQYYPEPPYDGLGIRDGYEEQNLFAAEAARMKPLANKATEGRVNPKGIPCLYLATEPDTAIAEVRPWIGSLVSIATFFLTRSQNIVDCSMDSHLIHRGALSAEQRTNGVWTSINRAFSTPVTPSDNVADYAPTQILAEHFRHHGLDGIIYGSRLGTGKTVALFGLNVASLRSCHLHRVKSLEFTTDVAGQSYSMVVQIEGQKTEQGDAPDPVLERRSRPNPSEP